MSAVSAIHAETIHADAVCSDRACPDVRAAAELVQPLRAAAAQKAVLRGNPWAEIAKTCATYHQRSVARRVMLVSLQRETE